MIEERINDAALSVPAGIAAQQLAGAALTPVRSWLLGQTPCAAEVLASSICAGGRAIVAALSRAG